ncbi:RNA polymerase ECF family sigma subunit [Motilibacter rhizosphaerae]|uniref:RNA polymerase sigma factor n=1 Tax=Motilibacter rhizosphaerae TaxID=598652 RepID=A0A4Q7NX52_9ACTN|nr:RNA polymerase subunit sigma-70 [Motilibacter rhizosphaerae]RZS91835.1 RNA polymerase ECF family sigma subunit [Motilibacter rhizosphaerae]
MSTLLERARSGDRRAFDVLVGPHRTELQVHCYRMLGSLEDAEDVVQETLLAAWTGLAGYGARSSLRTWLYSIATNRCLNHRRTASRRPRAALPVGVPAPTGQGDVAWLQPFPDALLEGLPDEQPGPEAQYESRETITLAFVSALQRLPAKQRAVLILRDVLGYSAKETAALLEASTMTVNNALNRARASLERSPASAEGRPVQPSREDAALVDSFVEAFLSLDVDAMVALMSADVRLRMPPTPGEYHGRDAAHRFLTAVTAGRRGPALLVPTRANTHAAWGIYVDDTTTGLLRLSGFEVVAVGEAGIVRLTRFSDEVAPWFGLAVTLPAGSTAALELDAAGGG